MNKPLLLLFILGLTFNACSSQTEKSQDTDDRAAIVTSLVIDQSTWESKISETETPQIIDVRTPEEYSEGHLDNALNIDFYSPEFKSLVSELDKDRPVFVYCRSGGRSAKACDIMEAEGFQTLFDLKGGYLAWK